jgi:hypothetical protein
VSSLSSQPPTANPNNPSDLSSSSVPLDRHRETFTASTTTYFTLVHKIEQELKAQASLIAQALPRTDSTGEKDDPPGGSDSRKPHPKEREESNGLGSLDVGVLKARLQGGELDMESKVWAEARSMLEKNGGIGFKKDGE